MQALLALWVDRHVQELAVAIAFSSKGCGLAVGVLYDCAFIERRSILTYFNLTASQSKL